VRELLADVRSAASDVHVMAARCARSFGAIDHRSDRLFLFNHFAGSDPAVALAIWEHLAGWYVAETGLRNSTLLAPTGESDYVLVNHASWKINPARLALAQFTKPTFRSYVQANLRAHELIAMPVLYRLVWASRPQPTRRFP